MYLYLDFQSQLYLINIFIHLNKYEYKLNETKNIFIYSHNAITKL